MNNGYVVHCLNGKNTVTAQTDYFDKPHELSNCAQLSIKKLPEYIDSKA